MCMLLRIKVHMIHLHIRLQGQQTPAASVAVTVFAGLGFFLKFIDRASGTVDMQICLCEKLFTFLVRQLGLLC